MLGGAPVTAVAATNLLQQSSSFEGPTTPWPWSAWAQPNSQFAVTASTATAPNGTATATELDISGTGTGFGLEQSVTVASTAGKTYTASIFMRSDTACTAQLGTDTSTAQNWDGDSSSFALTTNWKRYSVAHRYAENGTDVSLFVEAPPGCNLYVWGAQLEEAASVGPYIATTSAAASGAGGMVTYTTAGLSAGTHALTASYAGDVNTAASTSEALSQQITNGTVTELRSSTNPSVENHSVTFTAIVHTSGDTPTGSVQFNDGSTSLATVNITPATTQNELIHSGVFDSAWNQWSNVGTTYNLATTSATAPDGTSSATEFQVGGGGQGFVIEQFVPQTSIAGKTFTASVFLRADTACTVTLGTDTSTAAIWDGAAQDVSVAPAWQRYMISHSYTQAGTDVSLYVNTPPGCAIYLWGPQLEEATSAGPYVATTSAAATGSGGIATFSTDTLALGSHAITSVYSGDANFQTSTTAAPLAQDITPPLATITAVTSSQTPSVFGDTITFTATVSPSAANASIPTGTVTFKDGGTVLGTGTLTGGWTTLNCGPDPSLTCAGFSVASHAITAEYSGDALFASSTSSVLTQTVQQANTTTEVVSSAASAQFGSSVTFTATVITTSGSTPTGTVTFKDGSNIIGTGNLSGGWTSFTLASLSVGSHSITAVYGGDAGFVGSTSATLTQAIAGNVTTSTDLVSSTNRSTFEEIVTFTASVASSSGGTPTGSVTFKDGTTAIATVALPTGTTWVTLNCGASQACATLATGTHSITAAYSGDANFAGSTSSAVSQSVEKATTTTVLATSNPSIGFGGVLTLTASVSANTTAVPTGAVTFMEGTTVLGSGNLSSGWTTLNISTLPAGTHSITAIYAGDGNFSGSSSPPLTQTVTTGVVTTTTVAGSENPASYGSIVTYTASVSTSSGGTPTGNITFKDGTAILATVPLSSGASWATLNCGPGQGCATFGPGSHTITAAYSGDSNFSPSISAALAQMVNKAMTTTVVTSSSASTGFGGTVTFTASTASAGGTPTGTVTFFDGSVTLGSASLSTGWTTISISTLSLGAHAITASYAGDPNFAGSTSAVYTQTVTGNVSTTTAITSSAASAAYGDFLTFTASITTASGGTPSGNIVFKDGAATLSTVPLRSGASWAVLNCGPGQACTSLSPGSHSITAAYSGDTDFVPSTSVPLSQSISQTATTTALTTSSPSVGFGGTVTFTASVITTSGGGTPTGTVTFFDGSTTIGSGTLSTGWTTLNISTFSAGPHSITAVFAGDTNFRGSTSAVSEVQITVPTTTTVTVASSAVAGAPVTITATVTASPGTPAGSVTFKDGNNVLGMATLTNGTGTFTTATLAAGAHSLSATYTGDTTFMSSASPAASLSVAQDFTVGGPTTPSLSVVAGQSAALTITIASQPGGFTAPVQFSCSGLPALTSCTFTPAQVTPGATGATSNLSIATTARTLALLRSRSSAPFYALFLPCFGLVFLGGGQKRRVRAVVLGMVMFLCILFMNACGGGGGASGNQGKTQTGTPAGTYTIVVSAQSGSITHTINVNLTVQ